MPMRVTLLLSSLLALSACWPESRAEPLRIEGSTMGTTYHVTVVDPPEGMDEDRLREIADASLAGLLSHVNNWDPGSEVSAFSASASTEPVTVSPVLRAVVAESARINALSGGMFDVTLAPLIDLWGFGPRRPEDPVPGEAEIAAAMEDVGQADKLVLEGDRLRKTRPGVSVNLGAIAKGQGIDAVGDAIAAAGATRYLVEIGGDLVAAGQNPEDRPWSIGIERPDAASRTVQTVIPVSGYGMATSGDYRNYFEQDGIRYSHILDPTTGRPVTHATASVTVLAETAMAADGLATALLAMGEEAAMPLARAEDIPVMFITRRDGAFVTETSPSFDALLAQMEEK
ncbi:FAD:protein FMN transferase [Mangrovicoccus algicola]|uniref:FAD:protein FMN transferase n=1 Tax=Mangrovicoccus algicola TaxID=2771008 RepID=A0A8J6Z8M7_9RHOB|nr:FAD:protein FMN transferase [Mangrovicoccus algicola]MBE3637871.1 FAD:protein FMN transferase [Mangrovicoccus algicola]